MLCDGSKFWSGRGQCKQNELLPYPLTQRLNNHGSFAKMCPTQCVKHIKING